MARCDNRPTVVGKNLRLLCWSCCLGLMCDYSLPCLRQIIRLGLFSVHRRFMRDSRFGELGRLDYAAAVRGD